MCSSPLGSYRNHSLSDGTVSQRASNESCDIEAEVFARKIARSLRVVQFWRRFRYFLSVDLIWSDV